MPSQGLEQHPVPTTNPFDPSYTSIKPSTTGEAHNLLEEDIKKGLIIDTIVLPNLTSDGSKPKNIAALNKDGWIELRDLKTGTIIYSNIGKQSEWESLRTGESFWDPKIGMIRK